MKNPGNLIVTGAVRAGYAFWSVIVRILFRPKIVFADESAREVLRNPCVVISNHTSHMDGTFLPLTLRKYHVSTFVARDWYDRPKFNWIFRRLPFLPINRKEMDTEWLDRGEAAIKAGRTVLLFPEGKTSNTGELNPFHPGFSLLARRTGVSAVPVALIGGYRIFRQKKVVIGTPIYPSPEKERLSLLCRADALRAQDSIKQLISQSERNI